MVKKRGNRVYVNSFIQKLHGECVAKAMKGDINKKAIYEPICKSRRLPKVLISWFYHAEYS
ncbi:hypothetical protein PO184_24190 [Bacteroides ovatus]|uniref:hypothetical protein n=1 Tax=Bacteroides ovatus TaxID=28116 RepID=UPI0018A0172D|nr:hypothetical protein [Bacteroides ovatus]MDC2462538.1 hypothetical protein [Bacteroides ovatus]